MSCGACSPKALRPHYSTDGTGVVFGYCYAGLPGFDLVLDVRDMYFHGAEFAYFDAACPKVPVRHRPHYRRMRKCMRVGDTLLVPRLSVLGTKGSLRERFVQDLQNNGIEVMIFERPKIAAEIEVMA